MATSRRNDTDLNEKQANNLDRLLEPLYDDLEEEHKPKRREYSRSGKRYRRLDAEEKAETLARIANGETNIDTRIEDLLEEDVTQEDVIGWAEENYFPGATAVLATDEETATYEDMKDRDIRNW